MIMRDNPLDLVLVKGGREGREWREGGDPLKRQRFISHRVGIQLNTLS